MGDVLKFLAVSPLLPSTKSTYSTALRRLDNWLNNNHVALANLSPDLFLQFLNSNLTWGDNMRHVVYSATRSYIRWAFGNNHPFLSLRLRRPETKPQRVLNPAQLTRFLESICLDNARGVRDYAIISLMVDSGIRQAELCRLELAYLDLDIRRFRVKIKGGSWGDGVFSEFTTNCLLDWLDLRPLYAREHVTTAFVSIGGIKVGHPLTPSGLRVVFRRLSTKAGFVVSTHDLRRTFATLSLANGAPTEVVRRAGRWRNLEQIKSYAQGLHPEAINPYLPMNNLDLDPPELER